MNSVCICVSAIDGTLTSGSVGIPERLSTVGGFALAVAHEEVTAAAAMLARALPTSLIPAAARSSVCCISATKPSTASAEKSPDFLRLLRLPAPELECEAAAALKGPAAALLPVC